jgi:hypothetical protein
MPYKRAQGHRNSQGLNRVKEIGYGNSRVSNKATNNKLHPENKKDNK